MKLFTCRRRWYIRLSSFGMTGTACGRVNERVAKWEKFTSTATATASHRRLHTQYFIVIWCLDASYALRLMIHWKSNDIKNDCCVACAILSRTQSCMQPTDAILFLCIIVWGGCAIDAVQLKKKMIRLQSSKFNSLKLKIYCVSWSWIMKH